MQKRKSKRINKPQILKEQRDSFRQEIQKQIDSVRVKIKEVQKKEAEKLTELKILKENKCSLLGAVRMCETLLENLEDK